MQLVVQKIFLPVSTFKSSNSVHVLVNPVKVNIQTKSEFLATLAFFKNSQFCAKIQILTLEAGEL